MGSPSPICPPTKGTLKVFLCFGAFACFMAVLAGLIVHHLGADLDWDLLNYHFYNGYLWTHGLLIKDSLGGAQSYLEPELNSFFYFLISSCTPLQVNLTLAGLESLSVSVIWILGFFLLDNLPLWQRLAFTSLLSGLGLIGPAFWSELGSTMDDSLLAGLVIIALIFAVEGQIRKKTFFSLFLAFFLARLPH